MTKDIIMVVCMVLVVVMFIAINIIPAWLSNERDESREKVQFDEFDADDKVMGVKFSSNYKSWSGNDV